MNKETYEHAHVEIIQIRFEDVIMTSDPKKPEYEEEIVG